MDSSTTPYEGTDVAAIDGQARSVGEGRGFWRRVSDALTRPLWSEPPGETLRRRQRLLVLGPLGAFFGLVGGVATGLGGAGALIVVPGMAMVGVGLMHVVTSLESWLRMRGARSGGMIARADLVADVLGGGVLAGGIATLIGYEATAAITAGTAIVILSTWVRRLFLGDWIEDTVNIFSGNSGQAAGIDYSEEYDLVSEGRMEEAIARFEARSEERGGDPGPLIEAALVLRDKGRFVQVVEMYGRAMEAPGVDAQRASVFAKQVLDICTRKLSRPDLAALHLEALVARFPDAPEAEWAWQELTTGEIGRSSTAEGALAAGSRVPAVRAVEGIIHDAFVARASDIHLEDFAGELRVRYRIDGVLQDMESPPDRIRSAILSRIRVMAGLNPAESPIPQDARLRLPFEGREIDLRVSTMPTLHGESVALRILDATRDALTLESLGFRAEDLERLLRVVRRPNGMVLTTGPGGSGKSTTLHAIVRHLSSGREKIFTIEDPVEYAIEGVNQVSVNVKSGLTFPTLLRALVRQDPDVILVGEIRDRETAELATHASLTGHLVLSTLHTTDAVSALHRLVDIGVPDYMTVHTLEAVMAQRLVRRVCDACAQPVEITASERAALGADESLGTTMRGAGCPECWDTGYRGRLGLFEYLEVTEDLRTAFLDRATRAELDRIAAHSGMQTLREDGIEKIRAGRTTPEELLRVTVDERD